MTGEGLHVQIPPRGLSRALEQGERRSTTRVREIIADGALLGIGRKDGKPPLRYEIHSLVGSHEAMSYHTTLLNALPSGEIESTGHFGPWNTADAARTPVSGDYKFQRANLGVFHGIAETLSSEGKFQGVLGNIDISGDVSVPDFSVTSSGHSVPIRASYYAIVNGTNGDLNSKEWTHSLSERKYWRRELSPSTPDNTEK
jgi:hypothetical protein